MPPKPSSAAWLSARYSHAKGAAARKSEQIAALETRIAYHSHFLYLTRNAITRLQGRLTRDQERIEHLARAIEVHEASVDASSIAAVKPHRVRTTSYGGMSRSILRALRPGPKSIDDLRAHLAAEFGISDEDMRPFYTRVDVRLSRMKHIGTIKQLDPPKSKGRRWAIIVDYLPEKSLLRKAGYVNYCYSRGSLRPANWLIQTQLELMALRDTYERAGQSVPDRVSDALESIQSIWSEHPMHVEVSHKPSAGRQRSHSDAVCEQVFQRLQRAETFMFDIDFLNPDDPVRYGKTPVSITAIKKALKRLLLEGLVQRNVPVIGGLVEWSVAQSEG